MGMIMLIGWRNLWRNKRRSLIMIGAVVVGMWGLIIIYALNNGFLVGMVDLALLSHTANIQIHAKGYQKRPDVNLTMNFDPDLIARVRAADHVVAAAPRLMARSMIVSAHNSSGVNLVGIEPAEEARVTTLKDSIVKGRYLKADDTNAVLIGQAIADKLKVKPGKKIVIYTRGSDHELKALGLKVVGTFDVGVDAVNKYIVFTPLSKLEQDLVLPGKIHEIAVRIDDNRNLDAAQAAVAAAVDHDPDLEVLTWQQMFPFMKQFIDLAAVANLIMLACGAIAIALGMANTMIMAVFERFREIGIMKAVGTRPFQIFLIILAESICLALTGLVLGTVAGYATLVVWSAYGLDLSFAALSMKSFGMPTVIYPTVYFTDWVTTWVGVTLMAVLACLYPAVKAARKNPVEAMRT